MPWPFDPNPGFGAGSAPSWPYNVNPAQYIQQATAFQPGAAPNFQSRWYQPPQQNTALRDQLVQLFGNALMSQQQFPQLIQAIMQNPAAMRGQLGLLSPPQGMIRTPGLTPVTDFWRINWQQDPDGGASNTSSASGGKPVVGTQSMSLMNTGAGGGGGSANGATGDSSGSATGAAGSVGAGVGTAAGGAGATAAAEAGTAASNAATGGPL